MEPALSAAGTHSTTVYSLRSAAHDDDDALLASTHYCDVLSSPKDLDLCGTTELIEFQSLVCQTRKRHIEQNHLRGLTST